MFFEAISWLFSHLNLVRVHTVFQPTNYPAITISLLFIFYFIVFYIFQVGGESAGGGPGRHCRDILLSHHLLQETSTQLNHLISSVADPDTVRSEPFWSDPDQIKLFGSGSGSDKKV